MGFNTTKYSNLFRIYLHIKYLESETFGALFIPKSNNACLEAVFRTLVGTSYFKTWRVFNFFFHVSILQLKDLMLIWNCLNAKTALAVYSSMHNHTLIFLLREEKRHADLLIFCTTWIMRCSAERHRTEREIQVFNVMRISLSTTGCYNTRDENRFSQNPLEIPSHGDRAYPNIMSQKCLKNCYLLSGFWKFYRKLRLKTIGTIKKYLFSDKEGSKGHSENITGGRRHFDFHWWNLGGPP